MKVILLTNVKGLGKKDDMVEASDGYARNYLIPRKLAIFADNKAQNELKGKESARQFKIDEEKKAAREIAARLEGTVVKIRSASGADGRLYGAVTAKDIAEALEKNFGIVVDKRKMELASAIKSYGTYSVSVKLYTDIVGKFTVVVHE
ncbi:MAG: 50S ribosomal protein L9 [Ruminococcaceae bacterium]|nr:50S ribosomal protein L9 [Oscillospiraceae bacterium]